MAITRYENASINEVTNGVDSYGEYTTTITPLFTSRALVSDVANSLRIADRYRVYQDLVNLTFNYTPAIKRIVDNQNDVCALHCFAIEMTRIRQYDNSIKSSCLCSSYTSAAN